MWLVAKDGTVTPVAPGTVNITATAESGVTAICVLTISETRHINKEDVPAKAPNCTELGNIEYYACQDCEACFLLEDGAYVETTLDECLIATVKVHHLVNGTCENCGQKFTTDGLNTLTLPAAMKTIKSEAFSGIAAEAVVIPASCESIAENAFVDSSVEYVFIPAALEGKISIAEDAFEDQVVIVYQ